MKHRHIGAAQRNHIAKTVARRRKHRVASILGRQPAKSPRMLARAAAHETYADRVALDKLQGLETGKICREHYKKLCAKERKPEKRQKRRGPPREADTYRGKRYNDERGPRRSLILKAERLSSGETRSQADRRRAAA